MNFELIGIVLGMALYNGVILDVQLPMALYKKLLNLPVSFSDFKELDHALAAGLEKLLSFEGDVEQVLCRNFVLQTEAFGQIVTHNLKPQGHELPVTRENRTEYVELFVDWWLNTGVAQQFGGFRTGFLKACGGETLQFFRPEELELLICGSPVLDFYELEKGTLYDDGYTAGSATVHMFWEIVHALSPEEQKKFLWFATGSDRAPINGLGSLRFVISRNGPDTDRLLTAHTCFNHLLLPEYSCKDKMKRMILTAIENAQGFGLR